jgi:hypothetical protein
MFHWRFHVYILGCMTPAIITLCTPSASLSRHYTTPVQACFFDTRHFGTQTAIDTDQAVITIGCVIAQFQNQSIIEIPLIRAGTTGCQERGRHQAPARGLVSHPFSFVDGTLF